ncbi:MAG TPA: hypothetical protein VIY48_12005 [Candidatus Paceibacterota bacterium]
MKISFNFPPLKQLPGTAELAAQYRAFMYAALEEAVQSTLDEVRGASKSSRVRSGYYVKHYANPHTFGVVVGHNWWPYWRFQEQNTNLAGYWPPHTPGSRLSVWAAMHGISPRYVARLISQRGTVGNYIFRNIWSRKLPWMKSKLELAQAAFIKAHLP